MADKLADLSPEEKEKRIAEMKAKMQAAAAKSKAASAEGEQAKPTADQTAKQAPKPPVSSGEAAIAAAAATSKDARAVPAEASAAVIEESTRNAGSTHPAPVVPAAVEAKAVDEAIHQADHAASKPASTVKSNGAATNGGTNGGTAVATAPILVASPPVFVEETPEQKAKKAMNRREFLTYTWGAALGLLVLEVGVGMFGFMYPRFKAGEFGGKFFLGPVSSLPPTDAPPQAETAGKFWLVKPKASSSFNWINLPAARCSRSFNNCMASGPTIHSSRESFGRRMEASHSPVRAVDRILATPLKR